MARRSNGPNPNGFALLLAVLVTATLLPVEAAFAQAAQRGGYPASSAGHLIELCSGRLPTPREPAIGRLACQSYLAGFMDQYALSVQRGYRPFCLTTNPTPDQIQQVFESYAQGQGERLGEHRSILLLESLIAAFPCPTGPGSPVIEAP